MIKQYIIQGLLLSIKCYQKYISPLMTPRCRYYPTCSQYAKQALHWHGLFGLWLAIKRLVRCHPLASFGMDFVPLPLKSLIFRQAAVHYSCVLADRHSYVWHQVLATTGNHRIAIAREI